MSKAMPVVEKPNCKQRAARQVPFTELLLSEKGGRRREDGDSGNGMMSALPAQKSPPALVPSLSHSNHTAPPLLLRQCLPWER